MDKIRRAVHSMQGATALKNMEDEEREVYHAVENVARKRENALKFAGKWANHEGGDEQALMRELAVLNVKHNMVYAQFATAYRHYADRLKEMRSQQLHEEEQQKRLHSAEARFKKGKLERSQLDEERRAFEVTQRQVAHFKVNTFRNAQIELALAYITLYRESTGVMEEQLRFLQNGLIPSATPEIATAAAALLTGADEHAHGRASHHHHHHHRGREDGNEGDSLEDGYEVDDDDSERHRGELRRTDEQRNLAARGSLDHDRHERDRRRESVKQLSAYDASHGRQAFDERKAFEDARRRALRDYEAHRRREIDQGRRWVDERKAFEDAKERARIQYEDVLRHETNDGRHVVDERLAFEDAQQRAREQYEEGLEKTRNGHTQFEEQRAFRDAKKRASDEYEQGLLEQAQERMTNEGPLHSRQRAPMELLEEQRRDAIDRRIAAPQQKQYPRGSGVEHVVELPHDSKVQRGASREHIHERSSAAH